VEDESDEDSQSLTDLKRKTPMTTTDRNGDFDPSPKDASTDLDVTSFVNTTRLENVMRTDTQIALRKEIAETAISHQGLLIKAQTCSGKSIYIGERRRAIAVPYERLVASRSVPVEDRATKSYYGIDIHQLMDETSAMEKSRTTNVVTTETVRPSIETQGRSKSLGKKHNLMWTEKYRARKFTDLIGDERTHRSVLRWLKNWDHIVFPGSSKPKPKLNKANTEIHDEVRPHRKILLLAGPPGLGKTTLAHVCARQAGYEVQEINASDERSKDVVKGRIRDMVGTENVRGRESKTENGKIRKAGRPVCVVIDEVDGVVTGSGGGGEGGFIKALLDLVLLDQKNSNRASNSNDAVGTSKKRRKGDKFLLLRPLILVCNDVYHPSLRPLRQSSIAEIIHVRKPPLNMVVSRVHSIFEREGVPSDVDAVRRLCEATWGVSNRKDGGSGIGTTEGDMRSVIVLSEWTAAKLRATSPVASRSCQRLTKRWVEENLLNELAPGGGAARSLGRGGVKDVVDRVFQEGAGFPKTATTNSTSQLRAAVDGRGVIGVAEVAKRRSIERLREMIDMSGDTERILTDCFTTYPDQPIQDDTFLTKPNSAYEWLHFHDQLHSQLASSQDWELAPYLSSPILAFHHLFASSSSAHYQHGNAYNTKDNNEDEAVKANTPFSGPGAPYTASETLKSNTASIASLQAILSLPLARMYRSVADIATELLPYTLRMMNPDIKPVLVHSSSSGTSKSVPTASVRKASERPLVARAVEAMAATGVRFERTKVEYDSGASSVVMGKGVSGWVYRMEPALDTLAAFETMGSPGKSGEVVRYAVRQVLETEWKKEEVRRGQELRKKRMGDVDEETNGMEEEKDGSVRNKGVKRDFFGRVIQQDIIGNGETEETARKKQKMQHATAGVGNEGRVWVSFHEGFSNAVRKPITLEELMHGL
jgi:chromosome transmission fidelity protein 18